jgi:hypothetical protein
MSLQRVLRTLVWDERDCWTWGKSTYRGYAHTTVNGIRVKVHRFIYEAFNGPIPDGLVIDHLCRNRACANPTHLEAVTAVENTKRGVFPRPTHCRHGHEFNEANTNVLPNGERRCRMCEARRAREQYRLKVNPTPRPYQRKATQEQRETAA